MVWVYFLFVSLHLSWLFTGVCPDGDGFDAPIHTWFSQISTQKYREGVGGGGRGCCGLLLPFPTFGLWHTIKPADMSGFHTWAQLNCRTSLVNSSSLHRRPVPSKLGSWWKKMSMGGADCFSIPAPAAPRAADKYGQQYIRVYNPRTYQNLALI